MKKSLEFNFQEDRLKSAASGKFILDMLVRYPEMQAQGAHIIEAIKNVLVKNKEIIKNFSIYLSFNAPCVKS